MLCKSLTLGQRTTRSASKTSAILIKGKLDVERPPILQVDGDRVGVQQTVRILGVYLDNKLNFMCHINYVTSKASGFFQKMRRILKEQHAADARTLCVVYKGIYEGLLTYACPVWGHRATLTHPRRKLISSQRSALLAVTKAYNTTSNEALQVLSGQWPIDLRIRERMIKYHWRRDDFGTAGRLAGWIMIHE